MCDVVLDDAGVASRHARIVRRAGHIAIEAVEAWICLDGMRVSSVSLFPGAEVSLGELHLIAESPKVIELRQLISRLVGRDVSDATLDRLLRRVRLAAAGRQPLYLAGRTAPLIAAARELHARTRGEAPFVMVKRGGKRASLTTAAGGTICLSSLHDPLLAKWQSSGVRPQLMVLRRHTDAAQLDDLDDEIVLGSQIVQRDERIAVVHEAVTRAVTKLGLRATALASADRRWIFEHAKTLPEITLATERVLALREWGGPTLAAKHLGISHVALLRWVHRRGGLPGVS